MTWLKMTRLIVPALFAIASGAAFSAATADDYRGGEPPAVELEVREWSTPYTLDIPAELGRGRQSGHVLTYAPGHGQSQGAIAPHAGGPPLANPPLCTSGQIFAAGIGCVQGYRPPPGNVRGPFPLNNGQLALPDQRRYRQR